MGAGWHDHVNARRPRRLDRRGRLEELQGREVEASGQPLNGAQGEVALAALQTTHVGTVHADDFGEGFLGQSAGSAIGAQIAPHCPLEVPFHDGLERFGLLLVSLQTDK